MGRIKIELPETFSFTAEVKVRITDLNYGNHVGNDSFLALLHEARIQFLAEHNLTELSAEGPGLIMTDAAIEFKKELNYGDTAIIHVTADNINNFSFTLFYLIEKMNGDKKETVAKAQTGMLKYDYKLKKVMR